MKNLLFLIIVVLGFACGGSPDGTDANDGKKPKSMIEQPVDDGKGVGEVKNVELNNPLDPELVTKGKAIFELKCSACHKLTDQRVVGPGFKGLTERRKPEWIMNMVTNVEIMLVEDPAAQKLLEECLTRMPNQNLTINDARDVLEFIYSNDGYEIGG